MDYKARLLALRLWMEDSDLNALLVMESKDRQYLSGFSGSAGCLLVTLKDHTLITDGRYWDQVARQCRGAELFKFTPEQHENLQGALVQLMKEKGLHSLGIVIDGLLLSTFRKLKSTLEENDISFTEHQNAVLDLRVVKDYEEIEILREAAAIADRALGSALKDFCPGKSESELKASLEYYILKYGGTSSSFPIIVASGPNGSLPHAGASDRLVQESELITIDFGAVYQGYCSDMTRTIWYGELPERQSEILRATRIAQERALAATKAGIKACDLDALARETLAEAELEQYFIHSLGHGVGLNIHEAPGLRKSNEEPLLAGQVVTIEPGVYIPDFTGCRVEDTVLVTEEGIDILNTFPKQALDSVRPPVSPQQVSPRI